MQSKQLKKLQFMNQSQYASATKSQENLYFVEFQSDLNSFPNYSAGIWINANTTYTVGSGGLPNAGWFRIGLTDESWHGRNPQITIYINGQIFYINYFCAFTMIYLTSGNTFWCSHNGGNVNAYFFPVKTV